MEERQRIYEKVGSIIRENERASYIGEDDFVSLVKNGITIDFHIKNPYLNIENVFRVVKRAQNVVQDRFNHHLENIKISLYGSTAEMRDEGGSKSRYASWIAGIFDGRIRIVAEDGTDEPESLYIILTHEILHLAIYEISRGRCPFWLDEGLAVFLSQGLSDDYTESLKEAVKSDKIVPLELIENPSTVEMDATLRQLVYAEAHSFTEYLLESRGWGAITSMLKQCARRPFLNILADLNLNYYLLEQEWKRWIRNNVHEKRV